MITIGSFKPDGPWQCAICDYIDGKDQGEWYTNIACDGGRSSSFICDRHTHLTLHQLMLMLNKRQERFN